MVARGDVIDGRFVLEEPLGSGTFAAVWKAQDREHQDHAVALKLLFEHHASDDKKLQRFIQEARILERLNHPNVAQPIAWSAKPELSYLAMELIDGETLDDKIRDHAESGSPIPKEGVAWICDQLCAAMSYAHAQTIVHRDLKPRNVLISRRGQRPFLKVLDFGIAKILLGGEVDPTTVGKVLGSVLYMSPEQVLAQPIDHRADIFALGSILFEVITLHRTWARAENDTPLPFHVSTETGGALNSHIAVLRRIARDPRPRATALREDISPAVDEVLMRAMAIQPVERFDSVDELSRELRVALLAQGREPAPAPHTENEAAKPARRALPKFKRAANPPESSGSGDQRLSAEVEVETDPGPGAVPAEPGRPVPPSSPTMMSGPVDPADLETERGLKLKDQEPPKPNLTAIFGAAFLVAAIAIVVLAYLILAR